MSHNTSMRYLWLGIVLPQRTLYSRVPISVISAVYVVYYYIYIVDSNLYVYIIMQH